MAFKQVIKYRRRDIPKEQFATRKEEAEPVKMDIPEEPVQDEINENKVVEKPKKKNNSKKSPKYEREG